MCKNAALTISELLKIHGGLYAFVKVGVSAESAGWPEKVQKGSKNRSKKEQKGTILGARIGSEDEGRSGHDFGGPRVRSGSVLGSVLGAFWFPFRCPFSVAFSVAVWGRFGHPQ